jgi:hypothetical protein
MTVNPNAPGWYLSRNSSAASLAPLYLASARKSFYLQTAGDYFGMEYITEVPAYYPNNPAQGLIPQKWPTPEALNGCLLKFIIGNNATGDYSWWYRDSTPGDYVPFSADGWWDFNYVVLKNNTQQAWTQMGTTLMGPPTNSDGTGNLNLTRDVLYDSGTFPTLKTVLYPLSIARGFCGYK